MTTADDRIDVAGVVNDAKVSDWMADFSINFRYHLKVNHYENITVVASQCYLSWSIKTGITFFFRTIRLRLLFFFHKYFTNNFSKYNFSIAKILYKT